MSMCASLFAWARSFHNIIGDADSEEVALMKGYVAHIFRSTERWKEALPVGLDSLAMLERVYGGADNVELARTLNLVAQIQESLDDLEVLGWRGVGC
jgi:hypothetical protein